MGGRLFTASGLKSAFISLSFVVGICIYLIVSNQGDPRSLRHIMKKEDQTHRVGNISYSAPNSNVKPTTATTTTTTTTTIKSEKKINTPGPNEDLVLPRCSRDPPGLLGFQSAEAVRDSYPFNVTSVEEVAKANPLLYDGGHYAPRSCDAVYKVAIIIPMRGREDQLPGLLGHMHPIWQRQEIDYTVYVVTQAGDELFNKGKLMNAGFMEARKERKYDCYVFHDSDLLLEDDHCLYWCPQEYGLSTRQVVHLAYLLDKFNFEPLKYQPPCMPKKFRAGLLDYFGGITMFTANQFINANGFSNIYWGWGAEDNDAAMRVENMGYAIRRDPRCRYRMFKHKGAGKKGENPLAKRMMDSTLARQRIDGLNSLKYKLLSKTLRPLFTDLLIDVGSPSPKLMELMMSKADASSKCKGETFLNRDTW